MEDETRITGDDQNSDESAGPEAQKDNESLDPGAIDALLSKEEIDALLNVVSTDSLDPSDAHPLIYPETMSGRCDPFTATMPET